MIIIVPFLFDFFHKKRVNSHLFFYLCAMKDLILHLEYLLHSHNCVIVPNLGGFVVNTTPIAREGISAFYAPTTELVFNRDLTYDDGLLIESFMRVEKISSEAAHQKIKSAVKEIKDALRDKKELSLGDLGSFTMMDDHHFEYISAPFVRPEHYGMATASLQPVLQLQPKVTESSIETEAEVKQPQRKQLWRNSTIAASVAAIAFFILLLFPIQDSTSHHQTAQVLNEKGFFSSKEKKGKDHTVQTSTPDHPITETSTIIEENLLAMNSVVQEDAVVNNQEEPTQTEAVVAKADTPQYYIIAGVYEVRSYADNMLNQLKEEGYTNASTFMKHGRINVYSEAYPTIEAAHNALNSMVQKSDKHNDAWILKQ